MGVVLQSAKTRGDKIRCHQSPIHPSLQTFHGAYLCVYTSVYIYIYVYICTHVYDCLSLHVYLYLHMYMYIYIYIYI